MIPQGEVPIPEAVSEEKFTYEEVEDLLIELNQKGILGTLRPEVQDPGTFFDPEQGYIAEDDESPLGIVLDMYRDALIEGSSVTTKHLRSEEERKNMIEALAPGSRERQVLLAYYGISEETPWVEASVAIAGRQIHKSEDFPKYGTVSSVLGRLEKPTAEERKREEAEEREHYSSIPRIYEYLRRPLSRGTKLLLGASQEQLPKLEELLRARHKVLHPDAPFIVVDVAKIIEDTGVSPEDFQRDLIFREALKEFDPETADKPWQFPLMEFKHRAEQFREETRGDSSEGESQRIGLFIKNLDAATAEMTPVQVHDLIFSTFRVGWEFNIYGHVSSQKRIDLSAGAGEALNDATIIWEND
ncbi:MAG: hypothetical protein FJ044_01205 [Candidatus Cloacimonetes bacterium]|nr:hypothetical protein [Candidatus Cloacimonadota bacterium]